MSNPKTPKSKPESAGTFALSDYFTSSRASVGIKVPLSLPDGTPTADWLMVVGTESEEFRRAKARAERAGVELLSIDDIEERDKAVDMLTADVVAACIVDWSFDIECTPENRQQLVRNARYIREIVDRRMNQRALFFANSSTD